MKVVETYCQGLENVTNQIFMPALICTTKTITKKNKQTKEENQSQDFPQVQP